VASGGRFDAALAEHARLAARAPGPEVDATGARLAGMAVKAADEAGFAQAFFDHRATFDSAAAADSALRLGIADRLLQAGLASDARAVLAAGGAPGAAEKLLMGRIALAEDDPAAALDLVAALAEPDAAQVRAEALSRLGRHDEASAVFAGLGDDVRGGAEAWRAGDMRAAARTGPEPVQTALEVLATAPLGGSGGVPSDGATAADTGPAGAAGPVGRGRALLVDSRKTRDALTGLIAALSAPQPVAPAAAPGAARAGSTGLQPSPSAPEP
jgi:hypothetical protein